MMLNLQNQTMAMKLKRRSLKEVRTPKRQFLTMRIPIIEILLMRSFLGHLALCPYLLIIKR